MYDYIDYIAIQYERLEPSLKQADVLVQPYTYVVAGIAFFGSYSLTEWVLVTALVAGVFNGFFAVVRFVEYWREVFSKSDTDPPKRRDTEADDDQS